MAVRDIMPYNGPGAPAARIEYFPLNDAETFEVGEPVSVDNAGTLTESADDPVDADLIGIAAGTGDVTALATSQTGLGGFRALFGQFTPGDGAMVAGDMVPVYMADPMTLFKCNRFATDGAGTEVAPTVLNAQGERAGLTLAAGAWSVDTGATNFTCRIVDVLTQDGVSLNYDTNGTGVWVVFHIISTQLVQLAGNVDAPLA